MWERMLSLYIRACMNELNGKQDGWTKTFYDRMVSNRLLGSLKSLWTTFTSQYRSPISRSSLAVALPGAYCCSHSVHSAYASSFYIIRVLDRCWTMSHPQMVALTITYPPSLKADSFDDGRLHDFFTRKNAPRHCVLSLRIIQICLEFALSVRRKECDIWIFGKPGQEFG